MGLINQFTDFSLRRMIRLRTLNCTKPLDYTSTRVFFAFTYSSIFFSSNILCMHKYVQ